MKDTEYTYAVARIRSNEVKLLKSADLGAVVSAGSFEEACRRLGDKGYHIEGDDYGSAINAKMLEGVKLIDEILPDKSQFDSVYIKNDFANLKVILKSLVCDKPTDGLFTVPSVYDPGEIKKLVFERKNELLPEPLAHADRSAYRILVSTRFAQLADSVIDRASLEWSMKLAKKADNPVLYRVACAEAACADIRAAYRCAVAGKAQSFVVRCIAECPGLDRDALVAAACESTDALLQYLRKTDYAGAADALKQSSSAFEKYTDDLRLSILRFAKCETFGIAPLVGYYYALVQETANVRIILSAKHNGLGEDVIRERMRELYV